MSKLDLPISSNLPPEDFVAYRNVATNHFEWKKKAKEYKKEIDNKTKRFHITVLTNNNDSQRIESLPNSPMRFNVRSIQIEEPETLRTLREQGQRNAQIHPEINRESLQPQPIEINIEREPDNQEYQSQSHEYDGDREEDRRELSDYQSDDGDKDIDFNSSVYQSSKKPFSEL